MIIKMRPSRAVHGFTVVELLTVVGIVGLLAGVLLPVVGKVRQRSRQVECLGNLRHTGLALAVYGKDHQLVLPQHFSSRDTTVPSEFYPWYAFLDGTIGRKAYLAKGDRTLRCPEMDEASPGTYGMWDVHLASPHKVITVAPSPAWNLFRGIRLVSVSRPADTILLADTSAFSPGNGVTNTGAAGWYTDRTAASPIAGNDIAIWMAHRTGEANVLFVDGHVEAADPGRLRNVDNYNASRVGSTPKKGITLWKDKTFNVIDTKNDPLP